MPSINQWSKPMKAEQANECVAELLREVHSKSGTLTNAYVDEVRCKIMTTAAMIDMNDRVGFERQIANAFAILDKIRDNNENPTVHAHVGVGTNVTAFVKNLNEDPHWMQQVEALEHSLEHFGLNHVRSSDGSVKVIATSIRKSFPIGGTPKEVIFKNVPNKSTIEVNQKNAETILQSLGRNLKRFAFADVLRKTADDKKKRDVEVNRIDLFSILEALFLAGPEIGWPLRVDILDKYGIQES
jgi:hypothetical protein